MKFGTKLGVAVGALLASASPASAAWVEASTPHFVVYADENPSDVRDFAEKLERFDRAVRVARKMADPPKSPATRVTIYRVKDLATVRRLYGAAGSGVGGFYRAMVEGPIAIAPRSTGSLRDYGMDEDVILFHEYAHHLQLADMKQPMPRWLADGFAEFFSTTRFMKDGSVRLGEVVRHRDTTKQWGAFLPMETMLADRAKGDQEYTLYLLGWALTHYLTFEPSRRGQLDGFLADLEKGMEPLPAAQKNFGSISKLNTEVNTHIRKSALPVLDIQPHVFKDLKVTVRTLSPAEAAIMPWRLESKSGVTKDEAPKVAAGARQVAAKYPNDPLVLSTLAEAEIDADNIAAAEAAADRLLAIQPRNVEGLIFKGRALMERARKDSANKAALFKAARASFIAANKVDTEDPEPLAYFYRSYDEEGIPPTANAKAALHYASNIMPQDSEIRILSVVQYARDNQLAEARQALIPIAYAAHGGKGAQDAKDMMNKLAAGDARGAIAIYEGWKKKAEEEEKKQ